MLLSAILIHTCFICLFRHRIFAVWSNSLDLNVFLIPSIVVALYLGFFVIPLSILVGKLSMSYQDRFLMVCLLSVGICGLSLLIDFTDLFVDGSTRMYNKNNFWSVGPTQYVIGYFLSYVSIQSFEGIM